MWHPKWNEELTVLRKVICEKSASACNTSQTNDNDKTTGAHIYAVCKADQFRKEWNVNDVPLAKDIFENIASHWRLGFDIM